MKHKNLINEDGILLKFINRAERSYDLCYMAVEKNPKAIQFVPAEVVDDSILELVFNAGEKFIKLIPAELLTGYARETIKYEYPHIALNFGLVPMILDGGAEREYVDETYFNFLLKRGEKYVAQLPVELLTPGSVHKLKDVYPSLAVMLGLCEVFLDEESMETYHRALQIINSPVEF